MPTTPTFPFALLKLLATVCLGSGLAACGGGDGGDGEGGEGSSRTARITPTISFTAPGTQTQGGSVQLMASATSGLVITYTSSTPGVCSVNGATLTLLGGGTCTVTASQTGNATYAAAPSVSVSISVTAAAGTAQTISFSPPANLMLDSVVPALQATSTSGLPVSFSSATPSVCSVSGTTVTLLKAGTCTVAANQPGDATYAAATTLSHSFDVVALNAAAGKTAYNLLINGQSCFTCHGVPGSEPTSRILTAANAELILSEAIVFNKGGMGVLTGLYTAQQIKDIVAYLATPNF